MHTMRTLALASTGSGLAHRLAFGVRPQVLGTRGATKTRTRTLAGSTQGQEPLATTVTVSWEWVGLRIAKTWAAGP